MDETWLYHCDPETKQRSVEWRLGGSATYPTPQKVPSAKICWKSSRLDFLGSRRHPPHWLSSKGSNYQRRVSFISYGVIEGNFEGKTPREVHQGVLFLHDNAPAPGHLQPRRNWPIWASSVLITHFILRIWPHRTTTCSLDWKNNWKVAIFRLTWRSLLLWRPGWTDNLLNFFEWLAKVKAMG